MTRTPDTSPGAALSRRKLLRDGAAWTGLAAAASAAWLPITARRALAQPQTGPVGVPGEENGSGAHLVLLGTQGGPSVNLRRSQTAATVVVDGRPYLVDCGYGTLRSLVESGIGYLDISQVFLTHLHDDHMLDVAALLSLQWTGRSTEATSVYGPPGTEALVAGALAYFAANTEIRIIDEGRTVRPESLFSGHDVDASSSPREAFEDERVRVSVVENEHFPDEATAQMTHRSVAYRFDTAERSFVFSGDTAYSEGLIELARGAEILVCEAMDLAQHERLLAQIAEAEEAGDPNAAFLRHVAHTHVTTEQAGRMAAEAGVETLVLYHLLPGSNGPLEREVPDTQYIAGARRHFDGSVIVGRDQTRL